MKNKPSISNVPPIREMTSHYLESWKAIAKLEDRPLCLVNGLDIHPDGGYRINRKEAALHDAQYEYDKLMIRIFDGLSKND